MFTANVNQTIARNKMKLLKLHTLMTRYTLDDSIKCLQIGYAHAHEGVQSVAYHLYNEGMTSRKHLSFVLTILFDRYIVIDNDYRIIIY